MGIPKLIRGGKRPVTAVGVEAKLADGDSEQAGSAKWHVNTATTGGIKLQAGDVLVCPNGVRWVVNALISDSDGVAVCECDKLKGGE